MILDHIAELAGSRKKIMAGYDLGRVNAQVSYIGPNMEKPDTAATITGTQIYNIPTVLCKRKGVNQWYYGRSAEKMAESDSAIMVDGLLDKARSGETVSVDGEDYDPAALLTLFIKRSLSVLTFICTSENLESIMFTSESLDDRMIDIFHTVARNLGLDKTKIFFQDYAESMFSYMMYQPAELWSSEVIACLYDGRQVHTYKMDRNTHTTPIVVLIEEGISDGILMPENLEENAEANERLDDQFDLFVSQLCRDTVQSSVYLLGDGFKEKWMNRSLRTLCQGRHVFQGNNLFSIGACYSLMDKSEPSDNSACHVYLGRDKLKANVGMNVFRQGHEEYYALLDAGTNWYDADNETDCILGDDPSVSLTITPLDGQKTHMEVLTLRNIQERPPKTTRIHMKFTMTSVDGLHIEINDMGFGDIYKASEQKWEFSVSLN